MLRATRDILKLVLEHIALALRMLCDDLPFNDNEKGDAAAANDTDMVTTLNVPFEVSGPPTDTDSELYKDFFIQGELHLVGTCHVGSSSAELVRDTISRVRPDVVFIELDEQRRRGLHGSTFTDFVDRNFPRLSFGRDMRSAYETARTLPNCQVILGDRKLTTTLKRCLIALVRSASLLYLIALLGYLMFGRLLGPLAVLVLEAAGRKICMTKSGIEQERDDFRKSSPALVKALLDERDLFMTHLLHMIFEIQTRAKFSGTAEPLRVVAVVGAMHVPGITSLFGKPIDREVLEELCQ